MGTDGSNVIMVYILCEAINKIIKVSPNAHICSYLQSFFSQYLSI